MTAFIFPDECTLSDFGIADALPAVSQIGPARRTLTVGLIIDVVSASFGVTREDILSHKAARVYAAPRQAAMLIARRYTRKTTPQLGRIFRRDHSTVISGASTAEARMEHDRNYERQVRAIMHDLKVHGFEHVGDAADRVVAKALEARRGGA